MRALWRIVSSIKTSAALIALLAALLLIAVALPQEAIVGAEAIDQMASRSVFERVVLIDLGFAAMPTSPLFLAVLALFFVNLGSVLARRTRATLQRIRPRAQSASQLERRAAADGALRLARPAAWRGDAAVALFKRLGYDVSQPAANCLFAEKNRRGLLGFLVFHLSFFPIAVGGLWLYYSRFEATSVLAEGQTYAEDSATVLRRAPLGDAAELRFTVAEVHARQEGGVPVQLSAALDIVEDGETVRRVAAVNHPASTGHIDLLIDRAGVAPVFRLLDPRGETVDYVNVPAPTGREGMFLTPIGDAGIELEIDPVPADERFPSREQLSTTRIGLRIFQGPDELFAGSLVPGEIARAGEHAVLLEEVRYWTIIHVVAERGGGLLIAGFALAVIGLMWRMLLVRREVGVVWYDDEVVIFGRTEFYRGRFHDDLEVLGALLLEQVAPGEERTS